MNPAPYGCSQASSLSVISVLWLLPAAAKPKQTEGSTAQHWTQDTRLPHFCMEMWQTDVMCPRQAGVAFLVAAAAKNAACHASCAIPGTQQPCKHSDMQQVVLVCILLQLQEALLIMRA